jgi:hypothetical protein
MRYTSLNIINNLLLKILELLSFKLMKKIMLSLIIINMIISKSIAQTDNHKIFSSPDTLITIDNISDTIWKVQKPDSVFIEKILDALNNFKKEQLIDDYNNFQTLHIAFDEILDYGYDLKSEKDKYLYDKAMGSFNKLIDKTFDQTNLGYEDSILLSNIYSLRSILSIRNICACDSDYYKKISQALSDNSKARGLCPDCFRYINERYEYTHDSIDGKILHDAGYIRTEKFNIVLKSALYQDNSTTLSLGVGLYHFTAITGYKRLLSGIKYSNTDLRSFDSYKEPNGKSLSDAEGISISFSYDLAKETKGIELEPLGFGLAFIYLRPANFHYYWNKYGNTFAYKPEAGFFYRRWALTYGYNVFFKKSFSDVSKNTINLSFALPIF